MQGKSEVKNYLGKSDLRGMLALTKNWVIIIATIAFSMYANNIFVYLLSVMVIGMFQYALGETLMHEASHNNLFRTKKLNETLQVFFGWPFLVTTEEYRKQHFGHHAHLGKVNKDHVEDDYILFGLRDKNISPIWLWFGRPLLGIPGALYIKVLFTTHKRNDETGFDVMQFPLIIFWLLVIVLSIVFGVVDLLFLYWIIPLYWGYCAFLYWNEITEHYETQSGTRSTISSVYNWIFHNQGYHAIHHRYPSIPWFRLKAAYNHFSENDSSIKGDISAGFWHTFMQIKMALGSDKKN